MLRLWRVDPSSATTAIMSYRVISFTMAQVRQGSLGWHRQLGSVLREHPDIKVYSASPFDLDERRKMKDRFGGDIVYFFNEAACMVVDELGLNLAFAATMMVAWRQATEPSPASA